MPATAGRVRMPANNRVHSSAALQTHGIWQSAIGYDPYAPTNKEDKKDFSQQKPSGSESDAENAYANFQGLLALARITGSNNDVDRGACKKCGRVGHLKFQCKNLVKIKDEMDEKDPESVQFATLSGLDKSKGNAGKVDGKNMREMSDATEEEDSESSDADEDPEIERILAERYGKKSNCKKVSSRKKRESDDGSDTDSGKKRRGRSKKRRSRRESDDSGEDRSKRRKEKRRKRSESSDEDDERRRRHRKSRKEKRRRRSHLSEDSDSESSEGSGRRHRHKSRRRVSSSDSDSSGRNHKRSVGKKRRRRHDED